jgi:hypothetical protein
VDAGVCRLTLPWSSSGAKSPVRLPGPGYQTVSSLPHRDAVTMCTSGCAPGHARAPCDQHWRAIINDAHMQPLACAAGLCM